MRIWLDAQLSPAIAKWIEETFEIAQAFAIQLDEDLRTKKDRAIFEAARTLEAVVMQETVTSWIYLSALVPHHRFSGSPAATRPIKSCAAF